VPLQPSTKVWRYMSFAKLIAMLQKKQLWLSRADLLGDPWEVTPSGEQLNMLINRRPVSVTTETVIDQTAAQVKKLRRGTYVNCWTASEHESHALWRIYCPPCEGVAVYTTLERLRRSVPFPVVEVSYEQGDQAPDIRRLVVQKRPMFAYEQEVRIILQADYTDLNHPERETIGVHIDWDPEQHLEGICVHPEGQYWFLETVTEAVRTLAPSLSQHGFPLVHYSRMSGSPRF
jgi:hypothetical protein